jgi:hypothetical protein
MSPLIGLTNSSCSDMCPMGWFCPPATWNQTQWSCGHPSLYCPRGSSQPKLVDAGYYSIGGISSMNRIDQQVCPIGHACAQVIPIVPLLCIYFMSMTYVLHLG